MESEFASDWTDLSEMLFREAVRFECELPARSRLKRLAVNSPLSNFAVCF
jgi:hypothetical protein